MRKVFSQRLSRLERIADVLEGRAKRASLPGLAITRERTKFRDWEANLAGKRGARSSPETNVANARQLHHKLLLRRVRACGSVPKLGQRGRSAAGWVYDFAKGKKVAG